jgi:hypothetical protein
MKIYIRKALVTVEDKTYKHGLSPEQVKEGKTEDDADDLILSDVIGHVLMQEKSSNPWKQYRLTNEFAKSENTVELSLEDLLFVRNLVEQNALSQRPVYIPYILGQVIEILENLKDSENKEKVSKR